MEDQPIQIIRSQVWVDSGRRLGVLAKKLLAKLRVFLKNLDGFGRIVALSTVIGFIISVVRARERMWSYLPDVNCDNDLTLKVEYGGSAASCYIHFSWDWASALMNCGFSFIWHFIVNIFFISIGIGALFAIRWVISGFKKKA